MRLRNSLLPRADHALSAPPASFKHRGGEEKQLTSVCLCEAGQARVVVCVGRDKTWCSERSSGAATSIGPKTERKGGKRDESTPRPFLEKALTLIGDMDMCI